VCTLFWKTLSQSARMRWVLLFFCACYCPGPDLAQYPETALNKLSLRSGSFIRRMNQSILKYMTWFLLSDKYVKTQITSRTILVFFYRLIDRALSLMPPGFCKMYLRAGYRDVISELGKTLGQVFLPRFSFINNCVVCTDERTRPMSLMAFVKTFHS